MIPGLGNRLEDMSWVTLGEVDVSNKEKFDTSLRFHGHILW